MLESCFRFCVLLGLIFVSAGLNPRNVYAQGLPGSTYGYNHHPTEQLQLKHGDAKTVPFKVEIVGPNNFVERARGLDPNRHYGWGPGLHIEWGDGSSWPQRRSQINEASTTKTITEHIYTVPGNYRIQATLYHHGPTDASITDWMGEANVVVTAGAGPAQAPSLQILLPTSKDVFSFQEFPVVKWSLRTNRKVDIKFQILDPQNNLIGEDELKFISFNAAEQQKRVRPRSFEALEKSLVNGNHKFKIRMNVSDESGRIILSKDSEFFTMTREFKSGKLTAFLIETEGRPLEANFAYNCHHYDDVSYILDWGDGSALETEIKPIPSRGSRLTSKQLVFRHKFPKPGKYEVKIITNDGDPFKDVHKIPYYEAVTVEVKGG